ncbi:MAG TPA: hypothetical protein VI461_02135 [Chitinophagaceae bacterium]|nr:hypothetical protein [Chitinophagaceae bacterium]
MKSPELSQYLFWDTNAALVEWEKHAHSIIVRVLERGTLDDFREIRRYYGDEKITAAALKAKYLSDRTLSFTSFFYELPKTSFECYKNRQYQIPHLTF